MVKTKRPIITVAAVDVQCPTCGEFIAAESGSLFFLINEFRAGDTHTCHCCDTVVKIPLMKSIKVKQ